MSDVFIVSAVRTPIGKFMGGLAGVRATALGAAVLKEAVKRADLPPEAVDEVLMGSVLQAGLGQNPARQAALGGGLPPSVAALTLNKVCGSGLRAIISGVQAIRAGDADVVVAGGMESMSNAPYLAPSARSGARLGDAKLVDSLIADGLWDAFTGVHMGGTAELVADRFKVSRLEMDAYSVESHRKARAADFAAELLPYDKVAADEGPRADSSVEKLATLKPAFKPGGAVTAGNASQISDGAAALVLMSERALKQRSAKPLARISGYAVAGVEPTWVLVSTIDAVKKFDVRNPWPAKQADLVEINEAFAVSTVAAIRELGLDGAKVNADGGAIALGHPIGASGARIVVTLLNSLAKRGLKRGLAALCMGGGNGLALGVERP